MGRVLFVDGNQPDPDTANTAAKVIGLGGIVLSPTDTVYGLACDPNRSEAVERIREIKLRSADKGFLLLIPGPDWVSTLAVKVPRVFQQLKSLWPGPVTFLFAAGPAAPVAVVSSEHKVGLRCPENALLQGWIQALERPLLSTSANRSGRDVPQSTEDLRRLFEDKVDLLLLGREKVESKASTVVDLTVSPPRVVRRGDWADKVHNLLAELETRNPELL